MHYVPSQSAFVGLVEAGLGWGMVPEVAAAERIAAGALVEIRAGRHLDVPLYWQHWALRTPTLDDLTERVVRAAVGGAAAGAHGTGRPSTAGRRTESTRVLTPPAARQVIW